MKKRRIQTMFTALTAAAVFFTGCPTGHSDTDHTGEPDPEPEDGKTYILFQNANPYAVDVYSDSGRGNKAASVPAGRESKLEWTPNPDGSSFYLTYQIPVGDDVLIPYSPSPIGPYRIDEGKTTSIAIGSPASSPNLLTDRVYLLVYNESGGEAFRLEQQGGTIIKPEKLFSGNESVPDSISLVNPDERAWYIISAGSAAAYSVSASGAQKPFPELQAGWFYTFRYGDGGLVPDTASPLNLEVLLNRREVTFDADGGSPATQTRTVNNGNSFGAANMPAEPAKSGYIFGGWYTAANGGGTQFTASTTVSGNITVYAKWNTPVPAASLQAALAWLGSNAVAGGAYIITLSANETVSSQTLSYSGKTISITLKGDSAERTVSLSSSGSLFTVGSGVTLTLVNNITLQGRSGNIASLVQVNSGGALVMNSGSKISGNTSSGVYVYRGTFTMHGGEISGNTGGGVSVGSSGTFTMHGGEISGNTPPPSTAAAGVYVSSSGTFTMHGGTISDNTGGGVYVSGTFTMHGGEISGNTVSGGGGGVVVSGTFTMHGGEISGNTSSFGGGVYVYSGSAFTMTAGTISGNTASDGGGVMVSGTFTMNGGTISSNTANIYSGGGVYVGSSGTFTKSSGIIYGSNASAALKNTASRDGHAVYVYSSSKKRDTTAGEGVSLDSEVSGSAGGWE